MRKRNKHVGSSLDEFLKEEGILAETRAIALKDAIAWQVQQTMEKEKITKIEMARRMRTRRAALDRLLAFFVLRSREQRKLKREIDELKDLEMENRN